MTYNEALLLMRKVHLFERKKNDLLKKNGEGGVGIKSNSKVLGHIRKRHATHNQTAVKPRIYGLAFTI